MPLTLAEAIRTNRLADFIAEQEAAGNRSDISKKS
jgi:hypothetical protein